jgi:hypothetical protein
VLTEPRLAACAYVGALLRITKVARHQKEKKAIFLTNPKSCTFKICTNERDRALCLANRRSCPLWPQFKSILIVRSRVRDPVR